MSKNQYNPDHISPTCETIKDVFLDRAIDDFINITGINRSAMTLILSGQAGVTQDIAKALENYLGVPADFWLTREEAYQRYMESAQDPDWFKDGV